MPDEQKQTIEVEKVVTIAKGTTVFSTALPTPRWATWGFRAQFILNKMAMLYLSGTDTVPSTSLKEIFLIMASVDLGTWMLANSLGIKKKDLGLPEDN